MTREVLNARARAAATARLSDPQARGAYNAHKRAYHLARKAVDPEYAAHRRALAVNGGAVLRLRQQGRPVPPKEILQACAEVVKATPAGLEMDHIVPLRGYRPGTTEWVVSGLHVPHNLQPLTKVANVTKFHWFDPAEDHRLAA